MFYSHFWAHSMLTVLSDFQWISGRDRWNTLQTSPCWNWNTGGRDLWPTKLPVRPCRCPYTVMAVIYIFYYSDCKCCVIKMMLYNSVFCGTKRRWFYADKFHMHVASSVTCYVWLCLWASILYIGYVYPVKSMIKVNLLQRLLSEFYILLFLPFDRLTNESWYISMEMLPNVRFHSCRIEFNLSHKTPLLETTYI